MGKNILITSGTSGIGRGIIMEISEECLEVENLFIHYGTSDEAAAALKDELPDSVRDKALFIKSDLATEQGMDHLLKEVLRKTDSIDWLILNTGRSLKFPFDEYTIEAWNEVMMSNVTVPTFIVKHLRKHMTDDGRILFMGSMVGRLPHSSSLIYGVTKASVHFIAKSLLKEFDGTGVTVNAVAPGFIETRWHAGRSPESRKRINDKIAKHRFGTPKEVASLCMEVLNNGYINGTVLEIDGGYNYY